MAIYEQGYRPYLGPRQKLSTRPRVIAMHAIRGIWRRLAAKIILVIGLLVVIGTSIFLYLGWQAVGFAQKKTQEQSAPFSPGAPGPASPVEPFPASPLPSAVDYPLPSPGMPPAGISLKPAPPGWNGIPEGHNPAEWEKNDVQIAQEDVLKAVAIKPSLGFAILYQWALIFEGIAVFLLAMAVLCGLIANDRKSGAIPLYLTRSVTRRQYLWGKLLAAFFLCAFLLVVPNLILGILDFGFSLPGHGVEVLLRVAGALAASILWSALIGATVVGVSTLTPRPRLAAVFCALAAFLPLILAAMLQEIFYDFQPEEGYWIFDALSPVFLALQTAGWLLGSPVMFDGSPARAHFYEPLLLLGWILSLISFAAWRIRRLGETRE